MGTTWRLPSLARAPPGSAVPCAVPQTAALRGTPDLLGASQQDPGMTKMKNRTPLPLREAHMVERVRLRETCVTVLTFRSPDGPSVRGALPGLLAESGSALPNDREGTAIRGSRNGAPWVVILGFISSDKWRFCYHLVFSLSPDRKDRGGTRRTSPLYGPVHHGEGTRILGGDRPRGLRSFVRSPATRLPVSRLTGRMLLGLGSRWATTGREAIAGKLALRPGGDHTPRTP